MTKDREEGEEEEVEGEVVTTVTAAGELVSVEEEVVMEAEEATTVTAAEELVSVEEEVVVVVEVVVDDEVTGTGEDSASS